MRYRISPHLTFANVVSMAALFVALGGTATAVTYVVSSNSQIGPNAISGHKPPSGKHANLIPGSLNSQDIGNDEVLSADVRNDTQVRGGLRSVDIANGTLNDEDVGQAALVDFSDLVGNVPAGSCSSHPINMSGTSGVAPPDHVLLTPVDVGTNKLNYSFVYSSGAPAFKVCNYTAADIDGGTAHFSLLVFDAQ